MRLHIRLLLGIRQRSGAIRYSTFAPYVQVNSSKYPPVGSSPTLHSRDPQRNFSQAGHILPKCSGTTQSSVQTFETSDLIIRKSSHVPVVLSRNAGCTCIGNHK